MTSDETTDRVTWRQAWEARGADYAAPARLLPTLTCAAVLVSLGVILDWTGLPLPVEAVFGLAGAGGVGLALRRDKLWRERPGADLVRQRTWTLLPVLVLGTITGWEDTHDHVALTVLGGLALWIILDLAVERLVAVRARLLSRRAR